MKAIQIEQFGGTEVLEYKDVDTPSPGPNDVLVRVEAIGVNYADTMRREDHYVVDTPLPFIPGSEVAGEVVEVGYAVQDSISPGTKVVALTGENAYAEYISVNAKTAIPIPEGISMNEAVAIPLQGLTAYHVLKTMGRLIPGESVLIHAAAGGVGTLAVQLARHFGAGTILATASTPQKRELAVRLGADVAIDYTNEEWVNEVYAATDGKGADVALEMAGGKIFDQTVDALAPFGRLVVYGAASGEMPELNAFKLLEHNKSVSGFFLPTMMQKPDEFQASLKEIIELAAAGKLKMMIGDVYPLENAAQAHEDMEHRRTVGKIILQP
ncbi:quinone oxidoreductase family protein [Salisediminibacterium halotolerans]|uniref:NADPH2:quinone reductase n=1 Tax=Salisediminibacterium halotolerans TaxID=517425 RepID=A0A1H9RF84_9BACI|nr:MULTISPECIES: NADPH:quinone oxidoreductase family protein [Salisediminibacterium]RLJ78332.1 NADPH2:quinone reductase [Actinophytocola xinjiangensis]RPE88329.1 NADPH2:quinone reductase [Salisediminibacterium halotolerans]TWG37308.1 NADPH2:quinone reductase [Salisediminibacterium halotolerans]SER71352.1 NADPH2:quinone reductase [Salisediminibacterium haloalkalitolerans]GEL08883.1 NADPH:quinone reductase [Salisediminibacterium halotolerans]